MPQSKREYADVDALIAGRFGKRSNPDGVLSADVVEGLTQEEAMRVAMATERKLELTYTRERDGATRRYIVDPYSVRYGDRLYARHAVHGEIHAFLLSNIGDARVTTSRFSPIWDVEPETV